MRSVLPLLLLGLILTTAQAQTTQPAETQVTQPAQTQVTQYVTDEFEVTMRSGTSTANSIVRMLKSGEAVNVLELDLASKYSLVETEDGKKGYVLSRFLIDAPAARQQLTELQARYAEQQELIGQQGGQIEQLQDSLAQERSDNDALKTTLRASEQELSGVRSAAENTLAILEQNKQLQTTLNELQLERTRLTEENLELKDSTRLDWFVRGGAVSLIAFVVGILVTRIRWRKRDSWGSY